MYLCVTHQRDCVTLHATRAVAIIVPIPTVLGITVLSNPIPTVLPLTSPPFHFPRDYRDFCPPVPRYRGYSGISVVLIPMQLSTGKYFKFSLPTEEQSLLLEAINRGTGRLSFNFCCHKMKP